MLFKCHSFRFYQSMQKKLWKIESLLLFVPFCTCFYRGKQTIAENDKADRICVPYFNVITKHAKRCRKWISLLLFACFCKYFKKKAAQKNTEIDKADRICVSQFIVIPKHAKRCRKWRTLLLFICMLSWILL